ncbi:MAG: hypothetical protein COY80_01910 [Candidatus Pacebacteria bacterium CG_4_10_14_0_8_um_filter_42_14]|nr:MAG: hypothetical protein COY80_01910 [Candidatus Pacebacteria bacterium CG_4_10_14_0_8_um_filter_42_14]
MFEFTGPHSHFKDLGEHEIHIDNPIVANYLVELGLITKENALEEFSRCGIDVLAVNKAEDLYLLKSQSSNVTFFLLLGETDPKISDLALERFDQIMSDISEIVEALSDDSLMTDFVETDEQLRIAFTLPDDVLSMPTNGYEISGLWERHGVVTSSLEKCGLLDKETVGMFISSAEIENFIKYSDRKDLSAEIHLKAIHNFVDKVAKLAIKSLELDCSKVLVKFSDAEDQAVPKSQIGLASGNGANFIQKVEVSVDDSGVATVVINPRIFNSLFPVNPRINLVGSDIANYRDKNNKRSVDPSLGGEYLVASKIFLALALHKFQADPMALISRALEQFLSSLNEDDNLLTPVETDDPTFVSAWSSMNENAKNKYLLEKRKKLQKQIDYLWREVNTQLFGET